MFYVLIDLDTNEYLRETEVNLGFDLPDNKKSVPKLLEEKSSHAIVFDEQSKKLVYVKDERGKIYYTEKDRFTVESLTFDLPQNATFEAPPSDYHTLQNGTWVLTDEAKTEQLSDAKVNKLSQLNTNSEALVNAVVKASETPDFERQTWQMQGEEVIAYQADNSAPTPLLDVIAQARGIDRQLLIAKAYAKAMAFRQLTAYVAGKRQAIETQIKIAETLEALDAISIEISLPVTDE